jgi:alpha-D-ribose 1-methylphosphonate 5-triphosphate synthase subunit PhnL
MMPDQEPLLSVRGLRKEYVVHAIGRHVLALDDVDLVVSAGEHVVLVGPSGAGKSTLLRCIWRSCLPSAGELLLRRRGGRTVDLARLSDQEMGEVRDEDMGYVSQFLRSEPRRSVLDIVAKAATRGGMDGAEAAEASKAALSAARVAESLWGTYPVLLSGGEQQRVNLAAGTIRPPRLLLLDEPVSALDAANSNAVLCLVEGIAAAGTAVLSIFHDMEAVRRLATRVVCIEAGRVVADGPAEEVIGRRGAA